MSRRCLFPALLRLLPSLLLSALLLPALAQAATLTVTLSDQAGAAIDDAVVSVTAVDGKPPASAPKVQQATVDQVNEMFVPHVRAIGVGSSINFPNSDHIHHHVFSFSPSKNFELPLYIGVPASPVTFDKAGLVTIGCNIHDHMLGYIVVVATPWFAEVRGGKAVLDNLPAGQLTVEIWHPRLANDEAGIKLAIDTRSNAAPAVVRQLELRPERMIRRPPRRGGSRY